MASITRYSYFSRVYCQLKPTLAFQRRGAWGGPEHRNTHQTTAPRKTQTSHTIRFEITATPHQKKHQHRKSLCPPPKAIFWKILCAGKKSKYFVYVHILFTEKIQVGCGLKYASTAKLIKRKQKCLFYARRNILNTHQWKTTQVMRHSCSISETNISMQPNFRIQRKRDNQRQLKKFNAVHFPTVWTQVYQETLY